MSLVEKVRGAFVRDDGRIDAEQLIERLDALSRFLRVADAHLPDGDLVAAYYHLLNNPDPRVREQAARDWRDWEDAVVSLEGGHQPHPRYQDPRVCMAFARIVTHYFHHHAWLADGILLREAGRLAGIPGVLVHGHLDLGGPPMTAWELAQAWPDAELHLVNTGHMGGPDMTAHLIAATDRFAELRTG